MPCGVIHDDLYPFQAGIRGNGEVAIFDLHDIKMGPRTLDMALWLGAPDEVQERCLPKDDLVDIYLEAYCREGLEMHPSTLKAEAKSYDSAKHSVLIDAAIPPVLLTVRPSDVLPLPRSCGLEDKSLTNVLGQLSVLTYQLLVTTLPASGVDQIIAITTN